MRLNTTAQRPSRAGEGWSAFGCPKALLAPTCFPFLYPPACIRCQARALAAHQKRMFAQYFPPHPARAGKADKLKGFEFPKALLLEPEAWSVDNDLITPKFSLKRPNLLKHYQKQVGVYAQVWWLRVCCMHARDGEAALPASPHGFTPGGNPTSKRSVECPNLLKHRQKQVWVW